MTRVQAVQDGPTGGCRGVSGLLSSADRQHVERWARQALAKKYGGRAPAPILIDTFDQETWKVELWTCSSDGDASV